MKEEIREIRKYLEINEKNKQYSRIYGMQLKQCLWENFPTLKSILKSQNDLTFYIKNVNK